MHRRSVQYTRRHVSHESCFRHGGEIREASPAHHLRQCHHVRPTNMLYKTRSLSTVLNATTHRPFLRFCRLFHCSQHGRTRSFWPCTNTAATRRTISTDIASFVLHVEILFHPPSTPECRASNSCTRSVTLTHSKGLPHRHPPSLTDWSSLFLRAVIPWRARLDFVQGCMHAQTITTAYQPPRLAACTQPRLLTSPLVPITIGC